MYRVAICDDEKSSAAEAAGLLEKYKRSKPGVEFKLDIFNSSIELLGAMEKESYDIYLLDIYIDRMNGIEIAETIRKRDSGGQIIFMTSSNAFYKEAFRIQAVHYLEKPILEEEFFSAMDRVCVKEEVKFLTVRDSGELSRIPVDEILYIQSEDHYKRILTEKKSYFVRSTMQMLMDDLGDVPYFYLLGKNVIINLRKVLRITKISIVMEDGTEFSVPRGTYRVISELVLQYNF
ncbi:LytR/AlgR family response regulator transcription factor [Butyrivibrio sp. AE2015]|uniref:LytR/AlgR family response regulator transcription factor n=1 Tax=Butyrivibrio sp. AE2015 TaxID=1280663 RepID=UPI0003B58881|nr:LytTR family DNA-binding domain-containing protein [Butyrivibrio sp. AE2015]